MKHFFASYFNALISPYLTMHSSGLIPILLYLLNLIAVSCGSIQLLRLLVQSPYSDEIGR